MTPSLAKYWAQLDSRIRMMLLALCVVFALVEAWLLVLRSPWQQWQRLRQQNLASVQSAPSSLSAELQAARDTLAAAQDAAQREWQLQSPEAQSQWGEQLQRLAATHRLKVVNLQPDALAPKLQGLAMEVKGDWLDVLRWLHAAKTGDHPVSLAQMDVRALTDGSGVSARLRFGLHLVHSAVADPALPTAGWLPPMVGSSPSGAPPTGVSGPMAGPPQVQSVLVAGRRSVAMVEGQLLELQGEVRGYRLIAVHEDRAIFRKDGRRHVVRLDASSSP